MYFLGQNMKSILNHFYMRKKSACVWTTWLIFGAFNDIYSEFIVLDIYNFDVASTFFTDFYQLLLLRVAVSPIGELRSIVIVVWANVGVSTFT